MHTAITPAMRNDQMTPVPDCPRAVPYNRKTDVVGEMPDSASASTLVLVSAPRSRVWPPWGTESLIGSLLGSEPGGGGSPPPHDCCRRDLLALRGPATLVPEK